MRCKAKENARREKEGKDRVKALEKEQKGKGKEEVMEKGKEDSKLPAIIVVSLATVKPTAERKMRT